MDQLTSWRNTGEPGHSAPSGGDRVKSAVVKAALPDESPKPFRKTAVRPNKDRTGILIDTVGLNDAAWAKDFKDSVSAGALSIVRLHRMEVGRAGAISSFSRADILDTARMILDRYLRYPGGGGISLQKSQLPAVEGVSGDVDTVQFRAFALLQTLDCCFRVFPEEFPRKPHSPDIPSGTKESGESSE